MKDPITSNSITDRVVFTGLYVPEQGHEDRWREAEQDAADARNENGAHVREG